jgi:hypothetical protein
VVLSGVVMSWLFLTGWGGGGGGYQIVKAEAKSNKK